MDVRLPDGTVIQGVPDGTTKAELVQKLQKNGMAVPSEWLAAAPAQPAPQASQAVGGALRDIPRQVGLTARYGLEGLARSAEIGTEPIRQMVVNPIARLMGGKGVESLSQGATGFADAIGLPSPRTADERVVGDATRMVASAGGLIGAAGRAPNAIIRSLAANPTSQLVGASTAGLAGGSVREAGGNDLEQAAAALVGGVAGGMGAQAIDRLATKGVGAVRAALTPPQIKTERADREITLVLDRAGIDWAQVPERIKQGMRSEVAAAMDTGQPLNADAVRRLLVFRRARVTPTVGQLTQDPGQITREMNLAKTGANSTDVALQRLPGLQNSNTASLLRQLDDAGAAQAPTASGAGVTAIGSLRGNLTAAEANRDALYAAARQDTNGRAVVLDGPAAAQAAARRLKSELVGKLPAEVDELLNNITNGKTPLTVEYQQQLVKDLYRKMKGAGDNGDLRYGLSIVREALDNADIPATRNVNPGNLPAVTGTVPQSTQQAGQDAVNAFRTARGAHRELMTRIEGNPALQAVADGVEPDQFVQRFVVGKQATAADVQALRNELSPQAAETLKQYLVRHLRDAATNNTDDITKFSNSGYRSALRNVEDKLPAFFSREEIDQLRALGDAAKYMQAQPAGSAVNNSNSGALLVGRGLDMLEKAAGYVPLGGRDIIKGWVQGAQQTQVLAPRNALSLAAGTQPQALRVNPLIAAAAVAPPVNARDDQRRK